MSGLQKDAQFLRHLKSTRYDEAYEISEAMAGRVGRGVDEFVFLPGTVTPTKHECKQEDEKASNKKDKDDEKKLEPKSFLRVINTKTFFPTTDATLTLRPKEYKAAQKLGLTKHIDQALTAKLIGTLGDFRYDSRRDAVLYGIYDDSYVEEEAICQTIFQRAEALQAVERAHGGSPQELKAALDEYKTWLEDKIRQLEAKDPKNIHQNLLLDSYKRDLAHTKALLAKTEFAITQGHKPTRYNDALKNALEEFLHERLNEAIRHGRQTDELITVGSRINPFRGRLTTALVQADQMMTEHRFDQDRRTSKKHQGDYTQEEAKEEGHQRITLTSFHAQLGRQKKTLERFTFTAALILGDPPPEDPMVYREDRATWSSPGWARIIASIQQIWQKTKASASKFWHETVLGESAKEKATPQNPSILEKYKAYIATAEAAKLNFISVGLQDLSRLIRDGAKALWVSFTSIFSGFFEALIKLGFDFNDNSKITHTPKKGLPETVQELKESLEWNAKTTGEQVQSIFMGIFKRIEEDRASIHPKQKAELKAEEKPKESPHKKELTPEQQKAKEAGERIRAKIEKFIEDYEKENLHQAPFALPPHALVAYNPDDLLSASWGGMESFYQFFADMHDENPSICVYAMSIYLLAVASMAAPAMVAVASSKASIPMEWFIKFNQLSGVAMANGQMAQITSVAFTDWQIVSTFLEGLMGGEDSMLGTGARFAKGHFIETVGGIMGVYGVGVLLTHLFPIFEEELGSAPEIVQFFTGLKVVVGGYEAFESAPHERSIVGAFLFDLMDLAVLIGLRCPLSIVNALYMAILRPIGVWVGKKLGFLGKEYEAKPFNWVNVLRPWAELIHKIISGSIRLFDFLIRALNLLGRILKMFSKALTDFVFGLLVFFFKAVPILIMLALLIPIYVISPELGEFIVGEIGKTLRGLKDDTHPFLSNPKATFNRMAIEKQTEAAPSAAKPPEKSELKKWSAKWVAFKIWHCDATPVPEWLLRAKFAIYKFSDHYITRPVKNAYKACRNYDARYLKRREAQFDQRFLRWVAGTAEEARKATEEERVELEKPLKSQEIAEEDKPREFERVQLQGPPADQPVIVSDQTTVSGSSDEVPSSHQ